MAAKRKRKETAPKWMEIHGYKVPAVPVSDEDPAEFWGPNWREELDEAIASAEAGEGEIFYSDEEFFAALDRLAKDGVDANVSPDA